MQKQVTMQVARTKYKSNVRASYNAFSGSSRRRLENHPNVTIESPLRLRLAITYAAVTVLLAQNVHIKIQTVVSDRIA